MKRKFLSLFLSIAIVFCLFFSMPMVIGNNVCEASNLPAIKITGVSYDTWEKEATITLGYENLNEIKSFQGHILLDPAAFEVECVEWSRDMAANYGGACVPSSYGVSFAAHSNDNYITGSCDKMCTVYLWITDESIIPAVLELSKVKIEDKDGVTYGTEDTNSDFIIPVESSTLGMHGTWGDNFTWNLMDGVLYISGIGDMVPDETHVPWYGVRESVKEAIIEEGVTDISHDAFTCCTELRRISIPFTVTSIDFCEFAYCEKLEEVFYSGSTDDWNNIEIDIGNDMLKNATIYCNDGFFTPVPTPTPTSTPTPTPTPSPTPTPTPTPSPTPTPTPSPTPVPPSIIQMTSGGNVIKVKYNDAASITSAYILNIGAKRSYTYKNATQMKKDGQANGLNPASGIEALTNPMDGLKLQLAKAGNYVAVINYYDVNGNAKRIQQKIFNVAKDIDIPTIVQANDGSSAVRMDVGSAKKVQPAWIIAIGDDENYSYTSWNDFVNYGKSNGLNPDSGYSVAKGYKFAAENTGNYMAIIGYVDNLGFTHRIGQLFNVTSVQKAPTVTADGMYLC